jgi:hypothetical protein
MHNCSFIFVVEVCAYEINPRLTTTTMTSTSLCNGGVVNCKLYNGETSTDFIIISVWICVHMRLLYAEIIDDDEHEPALRRHGHNDEVYYGENSTDFLIIFV